MKKPTPSTYWLSRLELLELEASGEIGCTLYEYLKQRDARKIRVDYEPQEDEFAYNEFTKSYRWKPF